MKAALFALIAGAAATVVRRQNAPNLQWPVGIPIDPNFKGTYPGYVAPAGLVIPACFQTQFCQSVVTVTQYLPSPTPAPSAPAAPTPLITTVATPGVYTISGTVVTISQTTTILIPSTVSLTPGVNTVGTLTTSVPVSTVVIIPVPATLTPGVYTRPATTATATTVNQVIVVAYIGVFQVAAPAPAAPAPAPAVITVNPVPAPQAVKPVVAAVAAPGPLANGNKWAITYTPYTVTGQCKSAGEVMVDLQLIASKGFASVRLYATDCSGLENVGTAAKAAGLKLIIGVFIKSDGLGAAAPQIDDIVRWGSRDGNFAIVTMIVVGNEAVFNGYTTAVALAAFIGDAKGRFIAAGFVGFITTTEPLNILQASGAAFCAVIDVIGANIQPFFNSGVVAAQAGSFVAGQLALVAQICPGKQAYNLESGWPSAGAANGAAVPGRAEQQAAIADILAKVGDRTVFFSFADDAWKHAGVFGVEQNFGLVTLF